MPTSFGEARSSASTKCSTEYTSDSPFHQGHLGLEELLPSSPHSLETDTLFNHSFNCQEQVLNESTRSGPNDLPLPTLTHTSTELNLSHSTGPNSRSGPDNESTPMGRKSPEKQSKEAARPTATALGPQNASANGGMESHLEMRKKHPVLESSSPETQKAHWMDREGFSLDDEVPPTPMTPNPNASFFDLPRQDRRNFLLLVMLYFLQGIPMGLAHGSVPFLLKPYLSYGQIGVFSLATYPYSLKLLWSPVVDAVWSPALGRRKSWILPIQVCSGFGMLYLGSRIKDMMVAAGKSDGSGVWNFTGWWFFLVFLCATQDIAVDGKGLPYLSSSRAD